MRNATYEAHRNDFLQDICFADITPAHQARREAHNGADRYYIRIRRAGRKEDLYITCVSTRGYKLSLSDCAARDFSLSTAQKHLNALLTYVNRNSARSAGTDA